MRKNSKENTKEQEIPYSYLIDNIKILLIFLVVFNHIIAFQLVKEDEVVRFIWYGITIFHMPAFIFVSGYLSKKPQDVLKNVKNLLIPYILGYTLTWASQIWLGNRMDFELLRPSGTVMWYVLALFAYRLTIEAFGRIRFIVPLSIVFALWTGTRAEFSTFLSASRIVVFFPFFAAGYLWKSEYTRAIRKFKGKIVIPLFAFILLFVATNYMIGNNIPVAIFRGKSFLSGKRHGRCGRNGSKGNDVPDFLYYYFCTAGTDARQTPSFHFPWKKHNGNLFLPLSDHDRDERTFDPEASAASECVVFTWRFPDICAGSGMSASELAV